MRETSNKRNGEMENTLKFCIGEGKGHLRITNQVYSDEVLVKTNIVACMLKKLTNH
jgi:hypothetical protein